MTRQPCNIAINLKTLINNQNSLRGRQTCFMLSAVHFMWKKVFPTLLNPNLSSLRSFRIHNSRQRRCFYVINQISIGGDLLHDFIHTARNFLLVLTRFVSFFRSNRLCVLTQMRHDLIGFKTSRSDFNRLERICEEIYRDLSGEVLRKFWWRIPNVELLHKLKLSSLPRSTRKM